MLRLSKYGARNPIEDRHLSSTLRGVEGDKETVLMVENYFIVRPMRVRIVIAGPEQCGKSCIIKRYCEKRFVAKYLPTVGIDYGATRIYVDKKEASEDTANFHCINSEHLKVSVHIFDTSGASMFTDVRNEFYRDAHGLLVVLDVTRRETFDILSDWVLEIKQEVRSPENKATIKFIINFYCSS